MHLLRLSWGLFLTLIAVTSWRGAGRQIEFIRNGNDAPLGKYPFFVGIHIRAYGLICGGTLVHPSGVVLTVRKKHKIEAIFSFISQNQPPNLILFMIRLVIVAILDTAACHCSCLR